jgi:hypothetical protein
VRSVSRMQSELSKIYSGIKTARATTTSTSRRQWMFRYPSQLDISKELTADLSSRYRQLIGILRWALELGRVDIYLEVALLS